MPLAWNETGAPGNPPIDAVTVLDGCAPRRQSLGAATPLASVTASPPLNAASPPPLIAKVTGTLATGAPVASVTSTRGMAVTWKWRYPVWSVGESAARVGWPSSPWASKTYEMPFDVDAVTRLIPAALPSVHDPSRAWPSESVTTLAPATAPLFSVTVKVTVMPAVGLP